MAFIEDQTWSQIGALDEARADPRLLAGVCFSLCIEWAETVRRGKKPSPEEFNIFTHVSRHRAYRMHIAARVAPSATATEWIEQVFSDSWRFLEQQAKAYGYRARRLATNVMPTAFRWHLRTNLDREKALIILAAWPDRPPEVARTRAFRGTSAAAKGHATAVAWRLGKPMFFDPNLGQVIDKAPRSPQETADRVIDEFLEPSAGYRFSLIGIT